jgi:hypothetical protein
MMVGTLRKPFLVSPEGAEAKDVGCELTSMSDWRCIILDCSRCHASVAQSKQRA